MCYYIKDLHLSIMNPFLSAFPTRKLRYECLCAVRTSTPGTEGCARSTAVCIHTASCRSFDLSKQPVFDIWALLPVVAPAHSALSVAFLSGRRVVGNRDHSVVRPCALRLSQAERVQVCLPGCPFLLPPKPSFITFIITSLIYTGQFCLLYLYRDYLLSHTLLRRVGFIRCECGCRA